jgi:hypothetical protein
LPCAKEFPALPTLGVDLPSREVRKGDGENSSTPFNVVGPPTFKVVEGNAISVQVGAAFTQSPLIAQKDKLAILRGLKTARDEEGPGRTFARTLMVRPVDFFVSCS